jgi:hypothetical protein
MIEEEDMNETEKKELALSKIVLIVLAVGGLAAVVWFAWILPAQQAKNIDSFGECVSAGNPVQDSYPEVCTTAEGKRFTNPDQKAD